MRAFVQRYLTADSRVVIDCVPGTPDLGPTVPTPPMPKVAPGTGAEAVNPDAAWRETPPPARSGVTMTLPTPQAFTLPNGLTVIQLVRTGLPVESVQLVFKTGSDMNPPDRPGLAGFTAALLDQGTSTRDAPKIADDAAQIGVSLDATSTKDAMMVSTGALTRNFGPALDLLADISLHPTFPEAEVERQRTSRLASLKAAQQDPSALASIAALAALYGADHPYHYIELGTDAGIQATTRDDLATFWRTNFVPSNAALIVTGPMTRADLEPMVEKAFGVWPGGTVTPPTLAMPGSPKARLIVVDTPGSPQTRVRVATIGPPRSTPDYPALTVMNAVLGGLFSSRINLNLREEHGYTYGAGSQFVFRKGPGPFWVSSAVRTDVTAPAVAEILKEIKRMADTPMSAQELAMGKDSIVRGLPADFETGGRTVGSLGSLFVYDLGLDYYSKLPAAINAVTVDSAEAAARKVLDPDRMIVVAVGDRAKIEPALRALKIGQ